MNPSRVQLQRFIEERAAGRCEYCGMHQALQGATFHVDHIVPRSHGGASDLENLAWCCPSCNLHKSNRVESADPQSGMLVRLFNPRQDGRDAHFRWSGFLLVGLTPVGRATVLALRLNDNRRLRIRHAESRLGLFVSREEL